VKARVLLAEDRRDIREVLCRQLRLLGYDVVAVARNGMEAIALALSEHPDIILMDVLMPEMDGLEAVSQIRENPKLRQMPVLAVTGWVSPVSRNKYLASGFDDYIAKPFTHKELHSAIAKLLSGSGEKSETVEFPGGNRGEPDVS
jgi:CheY-like chemotaxis protein